MVNSIHPNMGATNVAAVKSDYTNALDAFHPTKGWAQAGHRDYSNAVRVERGIPLHIAAEIAKNDPQIDYFCYITAPMILTANPEHAKNDPFGLISYTQHRTNAGEVKTGHVRIFKTGDVVFFSDNGKKHLGESTGMCDTYTKIQ